MAAEAIFATLCHFRFLQLGNVVGDFWHHAVDRIGHEQTAGLKPAFAGADFTDIGNLARAERQAIECGLNFCVRVVAVDMYVDVADSPAATLADVIHQFHAAGRFQEDRLGLNISENIALAAVGSLSQATSAFIFACSNGADRVAAG